MVGWLVRDCTPRMAIEVKPVPKAACLVKLTPGVRVNRSCTVLMPALSRSRWPTAAMLIDTLETSTALAPLVAVTSTSPTVTAPLPVLSASAASAAPPDAMTTAVPSAAVMADQDAPALSPRAHDCARSFIWKPSPVLLPGGFILGGTPGSPAPSDTLSRCPQQ